MSPYGIPYSNPYYARFERNPILTIKALILNPYSSPYEPSKRNPILSSKAPTCRPLFKKDPKQIVKAPILGPGSRQGSLLDEFPETAEQNFFYKLAPQS